MGTYHYAACHDCRVVGMLPKSSDPVGWAKSWALQHGHSAHKIEVASEHDDDFDARVHGREITSYSEWFCEPITKQVAEPYRDVGDETMHCEWVDEKEASAQ